MNPNELPNELQQEYLDSIFEPYEKVRVADIRYRFEFCHADLKNLLDLYKKWVNQSEYFTLEILIRQPENFALVDRSWAALKCAKRGNDVYSHRVSERLEPLKKAVSKLSKIAEPDSTRRNIQHTNMLYVTQTYDTARCTMSQAWKNIGKEHNDFMSQLRAKYGKVRILRCWEAYENGYPHIHSLLVFEDHQFSSFLHTSRSAKNKDGTKKTSRRILRTSKDKISSFWHSHVDIQAVVNIDQAVKNVLWYVGKNLSKNIDKINDKELLTFVATWYHRKRSFSMSTKIIDLIKKICIIKSNSLGIIIPTTLEGQKFIVEYKFLSVELGDVLEIDPKTWVKTYQKRPEWAISLKST